MSSYRRSRENSPTILNLTFFYTGAEIDGPADLGDFTAESIFSISVVGSFTAQSNSLPPGLLGAVSTITEVPGAVAVPEPAMTGLIICLISLIAARRKFALKPFTDGLFRRFAS